jgi:xylulokinase
VQQSEGLISLGTSDVVLVATKYYNPSPEYHAFFHPAQIAPPAQQAANGSANGHHEALRYFNMLVYKSKYNGSLRFGVGANHAT